MYLGERDWDYTSGEITNIIAGYNTINYEFAYFVDGEKYIKNHMYKPSKGINSYLKKRKAHNLLIQGNEVIIKYKKDAPDRAEVVFDYWSQRIVFISIIILSLINFFGIFKPLSLLELIKSTIGRNRNKN